MSLSVSSRLLTLKGLPGPTHSSVIGWGIDCQYTDSRAYIDSQIGVWVAEVKGTLLAMFSFNRLFPVITFVVEIMSVDVVDSLYQAVQLIKFVQL